LGIWLERFGMSSAVYSKAMAGPMPKSKMRPASPSALFRLLCLALLASERIRPEQSFAATRALTESRWSTPKAMATASWEQRVKVLNTHEYARYDEKTSCFLADTSTLLLEKYGGDLRELREAAKRDPTCERKLLRECKGIGNVGVDIFFREAQVIWDELYPFEISGRCAPPVDSAFPSTPNRSRVLCLGRNSRGSSPLSCE
jgi:hypothetical protein